MQLKQEGMILFMKTLIPVTIPDNYVVDEQYSKYGKRQDIRDGVLSFREFLYNLYKTLLRDSAIKNTAKKGKVKAYDETSLSVEYPFLNNIRSILINIGSKGVYNKAKGEILMNDFTSLAHKVSLNKNSTVSISNAQMLKSLRVLEQTGLSFVGLDLTVKRLDHNCIDKISISYPQDPIMLIGLKSLGIAHDQYADRNNDDILLRCDYRFLSNKRPVPKEYINDYISSLSKEHALFVHEIHEKLLDMGLTCHTEMRMVNYHFMYMHKKKLFARFSASLNQGYRFVIKPKNTDKHVDLIHTFPDKLKDTILKGYGCNKKSGKDHGNCQNGCAGICFKFDETLSKNKKHFMKWLDAEVQNNVAKRSYM